MEVGGGNRGGGRSEGAGRGDGNSGRGGVWAAGRRGDIEGRGGWERLTRCPKTPAQRPWVGPLSGRAGAAESVSRTLRTVPRPLYRSQRPAAPVLHPLYLSPIPSFARLPHLAPPYGLSPCPSPPVFRSSSEQYQLAATRASGGGMVGHSLSLLLCSYCC